MFRFTTRKAEDEKLRNIYQSHNIKIPEKGLYGEQYLKECFNSNDRNQQQVQKPRNSMSQMQSKKYDGSRPSISQNNNNRTIRKHSKTFIQNNNLDNSQLGNSFIDHNKQNKSGGTYIFPNQTKQKSYYIIPSSKAGLMDVFEKYKDYTPKQDTAFKSPSLGRVTPQKHIRHFKALSQNLSSTLHNSDKKKQNYYDSEIPESILDIFAHKKLNQSTSFHVKTNNNLNHINNNENINIFTSNNNSFVNTSPLQQINALNNSFIAQKNKSQSIQKDNLFTATSYNITGINNNNQTKYKQTHNSCFRGLSREKITAQQFFPNADNPGPGEYENKSQFQQKRNKNNNNQINQKLGGDNQIIQNNKQNTSQSIQKLKKRIQQAVYSNDINIPQSNENNDKILEQSMKQIHPSHMFITDQRDRFGENQYINFFSSKNPMYSPGPGQYKQIHKTIQDKQEKIEKIKDQRKLLKEWLNPKKNISQQQLLQDDSTIIQNNFGIESYTVDPLCVYQFSYN